MKVNNTTNVKPYKIGNELYVNRHIDGSDLRVGERVQVNGVSNSGTKKNPVYRYYVRGYVAAGFLYHEDLTTENPTPDVRQ